MQTQTEKSKKSLRVAIFDNRCENCGLRPKHGGRDWCKRCQDRYHRKKALTPELVDKKVYEVVEPLYANAVLDDLEPTLRQKLLNREPDQDLYLYGNTGVGKTYALAALIRHFVSAGYECRRICFEDFCCKVRSTMTKAATQTEWTMKQPFIEVDMLFVDDLGLRSERVSDFVYSVLYSIINKRQEKLLPTLICSNKDLAQLRKSFDDRVISRLQTALVIELTGKDRRR